MAVTHQPGFYQQQQLKSDFQTKICACCDDMSVCFMGAMCLPCLGCSIASDMDECCMWGVSMPIRSVYRTKYNIQGSLCNDFMVTWCCLPCATCQLKRDINRRKAQGIF